MSRIPNSDPQGDMHKLTERTTEEIKETKGDQKAYREDINELQKSLQAKY